MTDTMSSAVTQAREAYESAVCAWHGADTGPHEQRTVDWRKADVDAAWSELVAAVAVAVVAKVEQETADNILIAIRADRSAIADFIVSCREGGHMTRVVQVFDVLAKKIREGEHLSSLPGSPR